MRPDAPELDISIVLPVHNEAGHLQAELDRITESMNRAELSWELIIVDDGSSDGSTDIALASNCCRVIRSERNRGVGSARRLGTEAARGRIVVWSDFRVPTKWLIRRLAEYLTQTTIPDLNTGFRAFRRDVARQYTHQLPSGFSCVTTITMAFLMNGYRVDFVPIDYEPRAGETKFHWLRDTRRYGLQVIRMMLSYEPLRVTLPLASVLGIAFAAKLGYDLVDKDLRPAANTLLLGFAVLQVLAVGLLADLVVRLTRPTQSVPPADVHEFATSSQPPE